jgi:predicted ATPase
MARTNRSAGNFLVGIELLRERVSSFAEHPFSLPVIAALSRLSLDHPVTFLVGENGSGKSTLLEAIAVAWGFNPEGGSRNFGFASRATHSTLHTALRLSRSPRRNRGGYFLRAESFYNVASEIDRLESVDPGLLAAYGGRSLHECSHGEAFLALLTHRFHGDGFYVLDEPEAALSPNRQLAVLARLHQLVLEGAQFIIATHSPILMAYPNARILLVTDEGLRLVAYEDTEHVTVTRHFLNQREKMLRILLDNDSQGSDDF